MPELKDYIIALILVSIPIIIFSTLMYETANSKYYNVNLSSHYNYVYNEINNSMGITTAYDLGLNMSEKMEESSGIGVQESLIILSEGAIMALKMPFTAMKIIPHLISVVAMELGVPSWLVTTFIALLLITLTFLILSAFLRWRTY